MAHELSLPTARRIFLDQGWNPRPLHWEADSYPLYHQGSPRTCISKRFLVMLLLLVVWGPRFEDHCATPYTFLEDSFYIHIFQTFLSSHPFFIYCAGQHSLGYSGGWTGLLCPRRGRSFPSFQQLCLVLLRASAYSRDLLVSRTLLPLNRDKCLQLIIKWRGRLGRLRFQTSFTEELVLKRHTTRKHALSPDTIVHSKIIPSASGSLPAWSQVPLLDLSQAPCGHLQSAQGGC